MTRNLRGSLSLWTLVLFAFTFHGCTRPWESIVGSSSAHGEGIETHLVLLPLDKSSSAKPLDLGSLVKFLVCSDPSEWRHRKCSNPFANTDGSEASLLVLSQARPQKGLGGRASHERTATALARQFPALPNHFVGTIAFFPSPSQGSYPLAVLSGWDAAGNYIRENGRWFSPVRRLTTPEGDLFRKLFTQSPGIPIPNSQGKDALRTIALMLGLKFHWPEDRYTALVNKESPLTSHP